MASARTSRWVGRLVCLSIVALLWWPRLDRPFGNGDEVIYAQNVRELIASADLATLRWQGTPVLQRPALPFVLASLPARAVPGEIGLRLFSLLCSLVTLGLIHEWLFTRFGRHDVAWIGVASCAGAPTFAAYAYLLMSDPPFVLGTTFALVSLLRARADSRWLLGVGAGLGAAAACKSLAVAVPLLAFAPFAARLGLRRGARRHAACALASFAALASPFFVLGFARHGRRFWEEHVVYSLWKRAAGDLGGASMGGPGVYLEWIWESDGWPTAAWIAAATTAGLWLAWRRRDFELWLLAGAALATLASYSAVGSRLPHYLLPFYPICALCAAHVYAHVGPRSGPSRTPRTFHAPAIALALLLLGHLTTRAERHLNYSRAAARLGRLAGRHAAPDEPILVHEWYAPAVAYYAERPLRLTTSRHRRYRALEAVDFFHAAGVPARVPPAPLPAGRALLVAGTAPELDRARWMRVEQVLGHADGYFLVRATALDAAQ